jgi:hypothetical protein
MGGKEGNDGSLTNTLINLKLLKDSGMMDRSSNAEIAAPTAAPSK